MGKKEDMVRVATGIKGLVSKSKPLFVHMLTRTRTFETYPVDHVTDKGIRLEPEGRKAQMYRIGMEGHSYDVFLDRTTNTLHATIYEGMSTPPANLHDGQWSDVNPELSSEFLDKRSSASAVHELMDVEEGIPKWAWMLFIMALAWPVVTVARQFIGG